jgi:general stress protein YciG
MSDSAIKAYLSSIGSKGGKAKGASKVRGDTDYYREIAQKSAAARKKKAKKSAKKKK